MKKNYFGSKIFYIIIRLLFTCQIHPSADIGKPAHFGHGLGIVIGDNVTIGDRVNITHHTTIASYTKIGDNFFMGPGSIIIQPIKIGDNVMIGANAVVTSDIPDNSIAFGIPARIKERT